MEHHLKVVKVNCIFLSGLCATYSGGLPGMLMTMSDAGNVECKHMWASGLRALFNVNKTIFYAGVILMSLFMSVSQAKINLPFTAMQF